jgi:broad specificity phosphatase PhoE
VTDAPARLWIVRHGESAGNLARGTAEAQGLHVIDVSARDADVPLSELGERQARALGSWFATWPRDQQPTVLVSSPYLRAYRTMDLLIEAAGLTPFARVIDERLREKEFGVLNRMTRAGIVATMPEQAELRRVLGKFYYRPPGGESWCDIVLRLRSLWTTLCDEYPGERVMLVCHSVVTLCFRYVLEQLSEQQILAIDRATDLANCALTAFSPRDVGSRRLPFVLEQFNFTAPMERAGEPVTREPDAEDKK